MRLRRGKTLQRKATRSMKRVGIGRSKRKSRFNLRETNHKPSAGGNPMARAAQRREPAVTFKHSAMVEVRRPKFKAFASLHQLDLPKLARADLTTIELGYLET